MAVMFRRLRGRGLAFVAAIALAGPGGAWGQIPGPPPVPSGVEPPVPLRKGLLLTPIAAAGSGIAPKLAVRVRIDERGKVTEAEVLSIEPPSDLDEAFREAALENLRGRRFAPARAKGVPVATTLEWILQFDPGVGDQHLDAARDLATFASSGRARVEIYARPLAERIERMRRLSDIAERHLVKAKRRRADTARFVVVSDAERPETAEVLARNLEATYNILDRLFRPALEPGPERYKMVAYVYGARADLLAAERDLGVDQPFEGSYSPPGLLAFHLEFEHPDELVHLMIHEATHAYWDRHLMRPGFSPPMWMSEGFAEYMGSSEIDRKGNLLPGRTLKAKYTMRPHRGTYLKRTAASFSLEEVQRALRARAAPTLAELLALDPLTFYSDARDLHYSLSWLFVHYLRHGDPAWEEGAFPRLALYIAEGYGSEEAIRAAYGLSLAELEPGFVTYARAF